MDPRMSKSDVKNPTVSTLGTFCQCLNFGSYPRNYFKCFPWHILYVFYHILQIAFLDFSNLFLVKIEMISYCSHYETGMPRGISVKTERASGTWSKSGAFASSSASVAQQESFPLCNSSSPLVPELGLWDWSVLLGHIAVTNAKSKTEKSRIGGGEISCVQSWLLPVLSFPSFNSLVELNLQMAPSWASEFFFEIAAKLLPLHGVLIPCYRLLLSVNCFCSAASGQITNSSSISLLKSSFFCEHVTRQHDRFEYVESSKLSLRFGFVVRYYCSWIHSHPYMYTYTYGSTELELNKYTGLLLRALPSLHTGCVKAWDDLVSLFLLCSERIH